MRLIRRLPIALALGLLPALAIADAEPSAEIAIAGRQFDPVQLEVPPDIRIRLTVNNSDALPAEFESYDLSREVVVPPRGRVNVYIGPLKPGKYQFFNDFNPSAKGWIVVKPLAGS